LPEVDHESRRTHELIVSGEQDFGVGQMQGGLWPTGSEPDLRFGTTGYQIVPRNAIGRAAPGMTMKRLVLVALFVVLVGSGYYFRDYVFGTATETKSARPPARQQVVADVAVERPVPIQVTAIGTVQPIATVVIKSRVDGEVAQVHFEEGQEVREGDLLFTLDSRAFQAQLAQSEANLERDRAQLQRAQAEVRRQTELATRGVASAQKLEDVQTAVAVIEAAIHATEAAIENARVNLNYTIIRSPIDGKTGSVALKRGNLVKSNDTSQQAVPLVTITQLRPIYVTFTVPERHLADIRAAMASGRLPVVATIPNQPQQAITGALTFVDNQVDVATGTISLKAKFANDDTRLWPGQFVTVILTIGTQANAIVVPSVAIQIGQNGPYVFVIKQDSTVELRLVRVNRTINNKTVIDEGIKAGERVVADGQLRLSNGTHVIVQQPEGTTTPKAQPTPVAER
jgi:multidrug efflux system membrane fusion protein